MIYDTTVTVVGNNDMVVAVTGDTTGFAGTGESMIGSNNPAIVDLALFRQGGAWDSHRVGALGQNVKPFNVRKCDNGAKVASIGMSLEDVLSIINQYAKIFSSFDPTVVIDSVSTRLRNTNVQDERTGSSLYQNGLIGHH